MSLRAPFKARAIVLCGMCACVFYVHNVRAKTEYLYRIKLKWLPSIIV